MMEAAAVKKGGEKLSFAVITTASGMVVKSRHVAVTWGSRRMNGDLPSGCRHGARAARGASMLSFAVIRGP
jgi:hypothetical protein